MAHFAQRLQRPRHDREAERGSLILDILIGMAIFALIAFIAATAVGQYRQRAYKQGAMSDAKSLAEAMQASRIDGAPMPAVGAVDASAYDTTLTARNSARVLTVSDDGEDFALCVEHDTGAYGLYDSTGGGMAETGAKGGCPAAYILADGIPGAGGSTAPGSEMLEGSFEEVSYNFAEWETDGQHAIFQEVWESVGAHLAVQAQGFGYTTHFIPAGELTFTYTFPNEYVIDGGTPVPLEISLPGAQPWTQGTISYSGTGSSRRALVTFKYGRDLEPGDYYGVEGPQMAVRRLSATQPSTSTTPLTLEISAPGHQPASGEVTVELG